MSRRPLSNPVPLKDGSMADRAVRTFPMRPAISFMPEGSSPAAYPMAMIDPMLVPAT